MNAQNAFVSMVLAVALVGLAFLGLSFGHAMKHNDLSQWGQHPLFASGAAALVTALLGAIFLIGLGRSSRGDAH